MPAHGGVDDGADALGDVPEAVDIVSDAGVSFDVDVYAMPASDHELDGAAPDLVALSIAACGADDAAAVTGDVLPCTAVPRSRPPAGDALA